MTDFTGTPDADTWFGTASGETAHGNDGNDRLFGNGGDDMLYGDAGNDVLFGGAGDDLVDGGDGDDILGIESDMFQPDPELSAGDQFIGGSGFDTLLLTGDFTTFDLTGISIGTDIERIETDGVAARLTRAQLEQFSAIEGVFWVGGGSGALNLTGGRFKAGSLFLDFGRRHRHHGRQHPYRLHHRQRRRRQ